MIRNRGAIREKLGKMRWGVCFVGVVAGVMLFVGLDQPLLDPDEGRQAEIAREMLANGEWIVPQWRGEPYFQKPPLQYWLTALLYHIFGVAPWTARLVPATAAWATVLLTYCWGGSARGRRTGLLGALILCVMPGFVFLGRTILVDGLLTACVVGGWYWGMRALGGSRLALGWWMLSALAVGLGLLQKGPVALLLVGPPLLAHSVWGRAGVRPGVGAWGAWVLVAVAVALPWYAAMLARHPEYFQAFFWRNHVVRYVAPFAHQQPWWYYGPMLGVAAFPWSLLWPALTYLVVRRWRAARRMLALPAFAAAWLLAFYSAAGCKSFPYLMPVLPPLALLTARLVEVLCFGKLPGRQLLARLAPRGLPLLAGLCVAACLPSVYLVRTLFPAGHLPLLTLQVAALVAVTAAVIWLARHGSRMQAWCLLGVVMAIAILAPLREALWAFAERRTPATQARAIAELGRSRPVLQVERDWYSLNFYVQRERVPIHYDCGSASFVREVTAQLTRADDGPAEMLLLVPGDGDGSRLRQVLPSWVSVEVRCASLRTQPDIWILRSGASR